VCGIDESAAIVNVAVIRRSAGSDDK
jgi:hypothetical protein